MRRIDNLEYLEKLKKDKFREFVIKEARADLEGRKLLALEIIAETSIEIKYAIEGTLGDEDTIRVRMVD